MAAMPETIINVVTLEGAKLTLTAGDTLVITADRMLTVEQRMRISEHATKALPDGVKVLVLSSGLTVAAEVKAADEPMVMSPDMAEQVRKVIEREQAGLVDRLQRAGRI